MFCPKIKYGALSVALVWALWSSQTILACRVEIDIKPQSCPNPINVKSRGVITIAIIGGKADLRGLDFNTLMLRQPTSRYPRECQGIKPIWWRFEDVTGPMPADAETCCDRSPPDGIPDLVLKFRTQDVVYLLQSFSSMTNDTVVELEVTAWYEKKYNFIHGTDCVIIKNSNLRFNHQQKEKRKKRGMVE